RSWCWFHSADAITCTLSFCLLGTPTTEISTLSLHDALPILAVALGLAVRGRVEKKPGRRLERKPGERCPEPHLPPPLAGQLQVEIEEHTSELQSRENLVCRLLLEKKKQTARSALAFPTGRWC